MERKRLSLRSPATAFLPAYQTRSNQVFLTAQVQGLPGLGRSRGLGWGGPSQLTLQAMQMPTIPVVGESWTAAQKILKNSNFVLFCSEISLRAAALQAASDPAFGSKLEFGFTVTFPTLLSAPARYILSVCFLWFNLYLVTWHNLFNLSTS